MRLPLSWLKDFIDIKGLSAERLAEIFTLLGHEVEKVEEPAKNLEKIYVGKVLKVEKHPNADKLRLAETRVSGKVYKIVCGGTNLREGLTVAVARPGARLRWHGEGETVELKETEIRGVKSHGMICASDEIGLEAMFPGKRGEIIELPVDLPDGQPLAQALGLDGAVLHLDITPNRADCFSVLGLARELAASLGSGQARISSKLYSLSESRYGGGSREVASKTPSFKLQVSSPKLCPKYTAQVFTNVKVGDSPLWIKARLMLAGVRPINNVVDITNYIMLEVGEPMHAFDFDKLSKSQIRNPKPRSRRFATLRGRSEIRNQVEIIIRNAKGGERTKALDGNTYELNKSMLVIADAKGPVAIAGVMGGEETAVTAGTKNVLLEAAIFDSVSVRKTSRKFGLRSESSARFEKGIAWPLPELAQARARALLKRMSNVKCQMSNVISAPAPKPISISQKVSAVNQMLNLRLIPARAKSILAPLGFKWTGGEKFRVQVPWWRLDIKIPEDLYEEVGRIYGLNKLSPTMLQGGIAPPPVNPTHELTEAARDVIFSLGYDEVYTYSFYGRDALEKDGSSLDREPHAQVANPISPNQEFLRTNLVRNLLDAASRNSRVFDRVKIFETGKVFQPKKIGELPHEETHLAFVCTRRGASEEEVFRKLKGDCLVLIGKQQKAEFKEMDGGLDIFFDNTWVGWIGLLGEARKLAWKIKDPCAVCEFNMDSVLAVPFQPLKYTPIPEFPPALRDLAFTVDEQTRYREIEKVLRGVAPLIAGIELFDVYRGKSIGKDKKSLAFHIILQSPEKTFSDAEIDAVMAKLRKALKEKLKAEIRT